MMFNFIRSCSTKSKGKSKTDSEGKIGSQRGSKGSKGGSKGKIGANIRSINGAHNYNTMWESKSNGEKLHVTVMSEWKSIGGGGIGMCTR
jgi:hypothetical protein